MRGFQARRAFAVGAAAFWVGSFILLAAATLPAPARATDLWAAWSGDPCCGIPAEKYKYLDANEACQKEFTLPPPTACDANPRNLRNDGGPQTPGGCLYETTCTCPSICGYANDPNPTLEQPTRMSTGKAPAPCTPDYLGSCDTDTAKGKGCTGVACQTTLGNPFNAVSGNKFQQETIYRSASGELKLVLSYNSQVGATYFQAGPFGARWSARYTTSVRDSGQGVVGVDRPDGRELQFRTPVSGNTYVTDPDIADSLSKVLNPDGSLKAWWLTASVADETFIYGALGRLQRVRSRAQRDEVMTYSTATTPISIAPNEGLLIGAADSFGRQLSFTYVSQVAQRRIASMTDPAGGLYLFEYDGPSGPAGANNLTKVTFPDGKSRIFFYAEPAQVNGGVTCSTPSPVLPNALTGIQDENGVRYATWTYDCAGRATSSQHALGTDTYSVVYENGTRTYTDPLGTSHTLNFTVQRILGVAYGTGTTQPAASGTGSVSNVFAYDANGNVASRTDYNGNRANYTYDLIRNLETQRVEGLTATGGVTAQTRIISTEWDANFRLPTRIAEPLRITTNVYDADGAACGARGALCSKTVQATTDADGSVGFSATPTGAPRTWTYTYNSNGFVLTVDGPRTDVSDVTTYTYYADDDADLGKRGNVATITNAAGQVTSITAYNEHGQPLTIVDPNGMTTTLTYDPRMRLTSRNVGGELTSYDYDGVGQLTKVTLPDGSFLSYSYDDAHRLTGMQDSLGNSIAYTLDAMGNRTHEEVRDPANALAQVRSRVYNNLNRLFQEIGAQSQTTEYAYDNQGNVLSVKDPLNHVTSNQYDALNRLAQVTDPGLGVTHYAYNGLDALTQVTDPRNLVTGYTVDGLGNLTLQSSPDTGNTTNTYDAAGNLLTQTDAKGQTTNYAYDALNRVSLITLNDGSKQAYVYDQPPNGVGRLGSITETDPATAVTSQIAYAYDLHGRVTSETRAIAGQQYVVAYAYDSSGRLTGMTYPDGRVVSYTLDALGRVAQVDTTKDSQSQTVVSGVAYQPFGGVKSYTLGNGHVYTRSYDQDGRIASYTLGTTTYAIGYDAANRIEFIADTTNPANSNNYGYDSLDRLTSAVTSSTGYSYSYDAVGNRLSKTVGVGTDTYAYSPSSNRIASIAPASGPLRSFVFDPNGSTTADGNNTYAYDTRGRMAQATSSVGTTTYQVNALGQRVRKTNSSTDTVFHYDTRGHLIAETDPGGAVKREIFYLGDIPVGVFQ
jgi:YD repeat-containing protein